jgi:4-hydroxy 2-oxovalerate aldolase
MATAKRPIRILDTTLRDGSYRVNFQFSARDTQILTRALDRLGFPYIEVGHGVGLGASERLPDVAAETDASYISAARKGATKARIAAFCVVGVARLEDLDRAADAGLQIVRVGVNADGYADMAPFIARARALGMGAMANLMKSYILAPKDMAAAARACEDMGAEAFYVVDSAGTMLPDDVARSLSAAHAATKIELGFHGHNNLGLAIANSLRALEEGASLLDGTLLGIGRCSGNAPTEILVSLLQRIHSQSDTIDRHLVMQLADEAIRPVLARCGCEGAVVTAYGMGGVHSSFGDAIEKFAAERALCSYSLVEEIGRIDRSGLPPHVLDQAGKTAKPATLLHTTIGATDLTLSVGCGGRRKDQ